MRCERENTPLNAAYYNSALHAKPETPVGEASTAMPGVGSCTHAVHASRYYSYELGYIGICPGLVEACVPCSRLLPVCLPRCLGLPVALATCRACLGARAARTPRFALLLRSAAAAGAAPTTGSMGPVRPGVDRRARPLGAGSYMQSAGAGNAQALCVLLCRLQVTTCKALHQPGAWPARRPPA